MGCGTSSNAKTQEPTFKITNKEVTISDLNSIENKPEVSKNYQKNFNLIWLDTKVNDQINLQYRQKFKELFIETFFVTKASDVKGVIGQSTTNLIFVSCGENYSEAKEFVEKEKKVIAICIFSCEAEKYEHYKSGCRKILGITSSFDNLQNILTNMSSVDARFLRFCDTREEKTFYCLKDKDTIIKSLTVAMENESFSIFYPLGIRSTEIKEKLTIEAIEKIENAANSDNKIKEYMITKYKSTDFMAQITNVTNYIREHKEMAEIIQSYTMENLYYMLNLYLRIGTPRAFDTFKEYIFSLKASMCKKGLNIKNTGAVYRGLGLKPDFLKMYVENKGKCILLNGFTSTTIDKNEAIKFTLMATQGLKTLFEIQIVDFDEAFAKFITDFGFPEENGVFFPSGY